MTTLIDTSAIFSMLNPKETHHAWCSEEFAALKLAGPLYIVDIVYSEMSADLPDVRAVDAVVAQLGVDRLPKNDEALFRAAKAFVAYRRKNKGSKLGVLPDFLIGAAAEVERSPVFTTDPQRFRTYFPNVRLVLPTGL